MSVTQMLFSGKGLGAISDNNPPTHHGGLSALRPGSGLPPNLTNPLNTLMAPPPARYQNNLAMAGIQQLPESFDWRKTSKKHNISLESVKNQNQCGNCWAMATASVLSDRYNVSGNPLPDLSPLYLIACDKQDNACAGGNTQSAGVFCETNGIAENSCANWENWCNTNTCSEAVKSLPCDFSNCKTWRAKENSTHTINGSPLDQSITPSVQPISVNSHKITASFTREPATVQNQLKAEIMANGPVVSSFWVFPDFMDQSPTPWSATNNIYIHGAYGGGSGDSGGHAVEIIGWGKGNAGSFGDVEYWIVKNSWGPSWNNGGYFKIAMTQYKNPTGKSVTDVTINGYTGFDVPVMCSSTDEGTFPFGGSVVFLPAAARKNNPGDWGGDVDTGDGDGSGSKFKQWIKKYWWVVLIGLLIIVGIILAALR
jgi:hypothetical protein